MNRRAVLCTICAHIGILPVSTKKKLARSRIKVKRLVARIIRGDKALIEKGAAIARSPATTLPFRRLGGL
jgi:hypothetical protein